MTALLLALSNVGPASAAPPAAPAPEEPPDHAITIGFEAGRPVVGHVLADADALAALKITLLRDATPRAGKLVPLVDGMRIVGLPQGERIVQGGIDTLLQFDANGDHYLDATDPVFAALRVFEDGNGDHRAQPGEVRSFADAGIESISKYGSIRMKER